MIDVAATTIDNNFQNCNYIFLCAPVAYNTAYLKQLTEYLNDDCILTDVGSVKTNIHEEVQNLGIGKYFIGDIRWPDPRKAVTVIPKLC